jgi:phosphoenolpyruvate synthase/pyruvate phosphate dikinase
MLAQMGAADRAAFRAAQSEHSAAGAAGDGVAQVFIVPICSTLALDGVAYERFLTASGALPKALRLLSRLTFAQPQTAENTRKQIQSLIMAAEVEYIVQGMSA